MITSEGYQATIPVGQERDNSLPESEMLSHALQPSCELQPFHDLGEYLKVYAREKPGTAAMVCLGIGFVLGWRLRHW
ncbi:hypothetical protein Plim_0414 [Planctopirus limnophila DSM 3776]|uniref:Uncharacterized protein n=1 Tax=Planctopirus limnophila (strain ATCC 43296 / DSM 3776 / IFAM 1008 / Mu 290) TaxID=521674 RepID=D5SPN4_PLAL2|nr:hypothetical protein [Planctopirus limnophila]ADG66264.1 hypothetical protein Plim_0414 [Planctopirus limnophila DSM 3776]